MKFKRFKRWESREMDPEDSYFDPGQVLPNDLIYKKAEYHLYRIGLCPTNDKTIRAKRRWIHRPVIVFTTFLLFFSQRVITTIITDNHKLSVVLGDWTSLVGFGGVYTGMAYVLLSLLVFGWQCSYIYNFMNGLEPTFLRLFHMMSGRVTPSSIGLTEKKTILKMVANMKRICTIMQFNSEFVGSMACLIVSTSGYLMSASLTDAVLFGIPNTILLILFTFYFWEVMSYQLIYIHFICQYLKSKIQELNQRLIHICGHRKYDSFYRIESILKSFDSLYSEINEYNKTYFSMIFLIFWTTFGSSTVFYLYISIFTDIVIYVRLLCIYFLLLFIAIFQFLIFTASSVNTKSFTTYGILNELFISTTKIPNTNYNKRIQVKIKMRILLERVAERRIGFSCWRLFIIDYFRCYEIISALSLLFLKIIEIRRNNSLFKSA